MSKEELLYISDTEYFSEDSSTSESYAGPILMGREREYFQRQWQAVQEFVKRVDSDLEIENKKKVNTDGQLFGISNQNHNQRI